MISKVLIVIPPFTDSEEAGDLHAAFETRRVLSPVEPAVVAADLLNRGFEVKLFDLGLIESGRAIHFAASLVAFEPDAVLMVQAVLTFVSNEDSDGKWLFDLARRHSPKVITILTGNHATNIRARRSKRGFATTR